MVLCYTQYTDAITWCFAIPNILMLLHGAFIIPMPNIQMLLHRALLYSLYNVQICYYMVLCYTHYADAITWCFD